MSASRKPYSVTHTYVLLKRRFLAVFFPLPLSPFTLTFLTYCHTSSFVVLNDTVGRRFAWGVSS